MEVCRCDDCFIRILSERNKAEDEADEFESALTAAQARVEELERMVVFLSDDKDATLIKGELFIGPDSYPCDGTPASILAAVQRAMGEK